MSKINIGVGDDFPLDESPAGETCDAWKNDHHAIHRLLRALRHGHHGHHAHPGHGHWPHRHHGCGGREAE